MRIPIEFEKSAPFKLPLYDSNGDDDDDECGAADGETDNQMLSEVFLPQRPGVSYHLRYLIWY